jgi:hypothetical protein
VTLARSAWYNQGPALSEVDAALSMNIGLRWRNSGQQVED